MIRKLQINNYKSLHELELDVGRFNVLIGENGCGKSNVLEAIALAVAAAADKLDNEFLVSRGIRVTDTQLMRAAFDEDKSIESIKIGLYFYSLNTEQKYTFINDNQPYSKWTREESGIKIVFDLWKRNRTLEKRLDEPKKILSQNNISDETKKFKDLIEESVQDILNMDEFLISETTKIFFDNNQNHAKNYLENSEIINNEEANLKAMSPLIMES